MRDWLNGPAFLHRHLRWRGLDGRDGFGDQVDRDARQLTRVNLYLGAKWSVARCLNIHGASASERSDGFFERHRAHQPTVHRDLCGRHGTEYFETSDVRVCGCQGRLKRASISRDPSVRGRECANEMCMRIHELADSQLGERKLGLAARARLLLKRLLQQHDRLCVAPLLSQLQPAFDQ